MTMAHATGGVREIPARGIVRGVASGPALVSPQPLSFLGDLDIRTGNVVSRTSSIFGQSVAGRVLVIPRSIGSAGAWRFLYQLSVHGTHPAAIVSVALPEPSLVQGAILAGVPIVASVTEDVFRLIQPGDLVTVDGTLGRIQLARA
jgi:predicted aconitase with swiveling domain